MEIVAPDRGKSAPVLPGTLLPQWLPPAVEEEPEEMEDSDALEAAVPDNSDEEDPPLDDSGMPGPEELMLDGDDDGADDWNRMVGGADPVIGWSAYVSHRKEKCRARARR